MLDLPTDLLWCTVGQGSLTVTGSAPKNQFVTEIALQNIWVHAGSSRLNRVEQVNAHLDNRGQQRSNRAIGMQQHLPRCVGVDPVEAALVGG